MGWSKVRVPRSVPSCPGRMQGGLQGTVRQGRLSTSELLLSGGDAISLTGCPTMLYARR